MNRLSGSLLDKERRTGMPEREKVMRGLTECLKHPNLLHTCEDCPYYDKLTAGEECATHLMYDALALLKEQKYVPSIGGARDFGTVSSHWYRCGYPECGFPIDRGNIYCRHCGNPIGWEPEKEWGGENAE